MAPTVPQSVLMSKNVMLSRLEASIMGESALIDKETGRIFWEGGESSTLAASLVPRLNKDRVTHLKATILSLVLLWTVSGIAASWLRRKIMLNPTATRSTLVSFVFRALQYTVLRIPSQENWIIALVYALYLIEAYCCSTRCYLANSISSPEGIEFFIEQLRKADPTVQWKVRSLVQDSTSSGGAGRRMRKTVSVIGTEKFKYRFCVDKTVAGVTKRAMVSSSGESRFAKILFSKVLVLSDSKTRQDYLTQQSNFVTKQGTGHDHAEFSTSIDLPGFRRRVLAVQPAKGFGLTRLLRLESYWIFTLLGLTVPFRNWFSANCDVLRVAIVKEVMANPPSSLKNQPLTSEWLS